jgi:hypothetical protein
LRQTCRQSRRHAWRTLVRALGLGLLVVVAARAEYGLRDRAAADVEVETGWTPGSKFLVRPNTQMDYANFGWRDYRERAATFNFNSGAGFDWFPTYDELGEVWLSGAATAFSWREDRTKAPLFGSDFNKFRGPMTQHNQLVVARESFANGAFRLSLGESIRTSFTSLTLDMARFSGVRADAVLGQNHELTALFTRPSDAHIRVGTNYSGSPTRREGTILGGGHWEGRFLQGGLLLGATYVNHHRFDSMQQEGSFLTGTMPAEMRPDAVMVRIMDDSPDGGVSAAVYDGSMNVTLRRGSGENRIVQGVRPVVVASDGTRWEDGHWVVDGTAYVEHMVPLPDNAVGTYVLSNVAGDYRIGARQVHRYTVVGEIEDEVRSTPVVTRSRSDGDGSVAAQEIGFEYGLSSAMNVGGFNGELALGGLDVQWEYARTLTHFQFPEKQIGVRSSYAGSAGFVRATQNWWRMTFGGEYFAVSPQYSSYALDSGDYREGNAVVGDDKDFITAPYMGSTFGFYFNEGQNNVYQPGHNKPNLSYPLVEDNDDDDQYQDQTLNDRPFENPSQGLMAGVYPGWDLDEDGVPDYNRNRNQIPDYLEPFFKYWQEEQVFYWGDDFNHNGVLDYFEDDSLPDYPYYKDEKGTHLFADFHAPLRGLSFRLGRFRIDQISGSGRNHVAYLSGTYRRVFPGRGRLRWEHQIQSVEDDIPNSTFRYRIKDEARLDAEYQSDFIQDLLAMRNSLVNRGYIGTRWMPLSGLNLHNNLRYELNHQKQTVFADGTGQESDNLNTWALVNKVDYTWAWRRLGIRPMFKHTLLVQDADEGTGPGGVARRRDVTELVPILRADYRFTDRTSIEVGAEGFPFLKERFLDRENESLDRSSNTYLAQIKMKGVSGGFNVFIITGMQYTKDEFDEAEVPSMGIVRGFFQVLVGEAILAAAQ